MRTLIGIFRSSASADTALEDLRASGFLPDQFILLTPQALTTKDLTKNTPMSDPPGACGANAGQVGGAITGFASGILGSALISLMIPGLGPVVTIGALALSGSFGAVVGGVVGNAVQMKPDSLVPPEECFIYEDALRQGAQIMIIQSNDDERLEVARSILTERGAESVTQARERWWQLMRTNEESAYPNVSEPFSLIEPRYRRGFETALDARLRGKTQEEKETFLAQHHPTVVQDDVFRRGFTRGEYYYQALVERGDPRRSTAFAAIDAI